MEEQVIPPAPRPNSTKVATKWALIYTAVAIVITYTLELLNADQSSSVKYITFLPFFGLLFLTQKEFREQIGGYMTFGQGFSAGFRYSVFTGLFIAIFTFLYYKFLSPDQFDKLLEAIQTQMEATNAPESQIDKMMSFYKSSWGIVTMAFGAAISSAVMGTVVGLIGAAILKKERSARDIIDDAIDPTV